MLYGAIDLHLRRSQIRIVDEDGRVVVDARIDTSAAGFEAWFGPYPPMRLLLESSTESEWVAQRLEACGHEVIVADPNYVAMYATRTRRIKTDRRDVAALADACRQGVYRRAHRVAPAQRRRRQQLRARRQIIRIRTQLINLVRATLRQEGLRLPSGSASSVVPRLARLTIPTDVATVVAPLGALLADTERQIRAADAAVHRDATSDPVVSRLQTVPGVGPVVALTFHAMLDTPDRFGGDARRAAAFVGVVPAERSSGERQQRGRITKTGPGELRALLIQASWAVWGSKTTAARALREWAQALAARRGRRIAIVALARRLVRILFAVWRDGTTFRGRRALGASDSCVVTPAT
jgi:transposase